MQGLASRSPQLDSSSREEMYYSRDPIRWSTTRAASRWYPHVQLDEDSAFLIPQASREWLDRSRYHDGCGGVDGGEIPAGLRQAAAGERREVGEGGRRLG